MVDKNSFSEKPNVEKEIRFAVVMYGGVSLAIYINGVAQELYKMVRATAIKEDGSYYIANPIGTEAVYRELGSKLKARFVVDVLSGTSAGGINAVYLAKALANDQDICKLEDVWIQEGNILSLINDQDSIKDIDGKSIDGLIYEPPPKSLLNSERIYNKLFAALERMDEGSTAKDTSPFVDELDLYVTSTDLDGVVRPILLQDREALEKRFRAVFRFHYSTLGNKSYWLKPFRQENNPFLAFVARATCALPAFRPARFLDTRDLKGKTFSESSNYEELTNIWSNFPRDYNYKEDSFEERPFGDGGALDNKPFSYITETLLRRQSDVPIDRRLFFIEPAPEQLENIEQRRPSEPDMLQNLAAQGFNLPRYETIREDLAQIKARNDLIERTNNILRNIERTRIDIGDWKGSKEDWRLKYLDQMLEEDDLYGSGYAAYHQLRVADVLDQFASTVARNIGIDEGCSEFTVLRQLFEGWRRCYYSTHADEQLPSENELLFRLDLNWRMRRLSFLLSLLDHIRLGITGLRTDLGTRNLSSEEQYAQEIISQSIQDKKDKVHAPTWSIPDLKTEKQYLDAIYQIKSSLNKAYILLKNRGRRLRQRNLVSRPITSKEFKEDPELIEYVQILQPYKQIVPHIMQAFQSSASQENAWNDLERLSLSLASRQTSEAQQPAGYLYKTFSDVSHCSQQVLSPEAAGSKTASVEKPSLVMENVRTCLNFYYENFEYYDKITFPITYATPIGEADVVEVYRISPQDASTLFQERKDKHKLAGIKYLNFGAFFLEEWRQNDILWGQLDGAERIITTLLPEPSPDADPQEKEEYRRIKDEYLVKAWLKILKEKQNILGLQNRIKLQERFEKVEPLQNGSGSVWQRFEGSQEFSSEEFRALKGQLSSFFEHDYEVGAKPGADTIASVMSRSVQVLDGLFTDLVDKKFPKRTNGLGLLVHFLIALVPGTAGSKTIQRWLSIAYVVEIFLLALSILMVRAGIGLTEFGIFLFSLSVIFLMLTGLFHIAIHLIGERIRNLLQSLLSEEEV